MYLLYLKRNNEKTKYFVFLQYKIDCRVTIELLDTESEENIEKTVENTTKWNDYVDNLKNPLSSNKVVNNSSANNSGVNNSEIFEPSNVEIKMEKPDEENVS